MRLYKPPKDKNYNTELSKIFRTRPFEGEIENLNVDDVADIDRIFAPPNIYIPKTIGLV